jgi:cation transport protein ChaC|tara:strand:- start:315 stop:866 length:552 start_codon:yes stop_codon:yes gene_type:complete
MVKWWCAMWIFGYGSLLWDPGFEPVEQVRADLQGYNRSFCMLSIHHRGTEVNPGLVLALAEAGAAAICSGMAMRVSEAQADEVLANLRERELISSAYEEKWINLTLIDGRCVRAVTYVVDQNHVQYCQYDLDRQARIIASAVGGRGPNPEYLYKTAELLQSLHIPDTELNYLAKAVAKLTKSA